ncbi:hypothetical protein HYV84_03395 [Candidatus Woesearchaeota archaeon]|nr:hypothetical protein [Candidatus Woesearchaeota archaeon]
MADNNPLKEKGSEKAEQPLAGGLEGILKAGFYGALGIASVAVGTAAFGIDGLSNALAFPAAEWVAGKIEGKPINLEKIAKQSLSGVAMTPVFQYGWGLMEDIAPIERLSNVYKATGSLRSTGSFGFSHWKEYAARTGLIASGYLPAGVAANQIIDYAIGNGSLAGVGSELKKNWWKTTKKVIWQVTPLVAINAFLVPAGLNVATGALVSFAYRIIAALGSRKNSPAKVKQSGPEYTPPMRYAPSYNYR